MSFFYSLFSSLSIRFPPVSLSFSVPLYVSVFMWVVFVSFLLPYSSPCVSPAYHVNPCSPDHHVPLFCSLTNVPSLSRLPFLTLCQAYLSVLRSIVSCFIVRVLRSMFIVFSFATSVSLCLICLCCVPHVFPVRSSFLVHLSPLFSSVQHRNLHPVFYLFSFMCIPCLVSFVSLVFSNKAAFGLQFISVSLHLGPFPPASHGQFMTTRLAGFSADRQFRIELCETLTQQTFSPFKHSLSSRKV